MKKFLLGLAALLSFGSPVLAQAEVVAGSPAATRVTGNRDAEGYFQWKTVGIRNMRVYQGAEFVRHSQVLAMRKAGLTEAEVTEVVTALQNKTAEEGVMTKGMRFGAMSYSTPKGVVVQKKVMYVGEESHRIWRVRTSGGRVITIVEKCDNVGLEEAPPPPPAPVPPPPPVVELPPAPVPPPLDTPPTPAAKRFCTNWRLNAVVGAELELAKGMSRSLYGAWGIYCMKKLDDGEIGFGGAGQAAVYGGDPGRGHFNGHFIAGGIGMMRTWNTGQDLEAKLMIGDYVSNYRESDYRAREHRTMLALSVAHNDFSGLIDGSNRPKRQIFGMVGLPIGGSGSHTWQGKDIGDFNRLSLYYNAGVRQYLLKHDPKRAWNPYVQVGILGEIRSGEDYFSCSVRVGVSNRRETIGLHAGINTCNGSIVPAIGAWYDLGTDLRLKRAERRAAAIAEDTGEGREATTTIRGRRLMATRE